MPAVARVVHYDAEQREESKFERAVLDALVGPNEHDPAILILQLAQRGMDQFLVREALWRLISEGKVALTSERKIRVRPS